MKLSKVELFYCKVLSVCPNCSRQSILDLYYQLGDSSIWEFAQSEGATSIIGQQLIILLGNDLIPKHWLDAVSSAEHRIGMYMDQLDRAASALESEGINLVALKNSGIARALHKQLASTPMGDVDVLVSPHDFHAAHIILERLGFKIDDRSPFAVSDIEDAEIHGGAEYRVPLPDGTELWFELQWRPVAGRWIRPDQEPYADELLCRSIPISGSSARLLAPEDNLLQVCLHTAKHSYVRSPGFRLHTDVDRIVHYCDIDWDSFCSRVERTELRTAVFLSLLIPKQLLGSNIPSYVLTRLDFFPLKHRFMVSWIKRVGLFHPSKRKWSKLGYILFNILLYDTFSGLWRALFPDPDTVTNHSSISHPLALPFAYIQRLFSLLFTRANT